MDANIDTWNTDEQLHYLRKISEALAMPHLNCRNRECRRKMACCGAADVMEPVCWSRMPRGMSKPAATFGQAVYRLRRAFLLKQTEPEWLAKLDTVQMGLAEGAIRALIPRRRWRELRRWLISLGVDQELLIVKPPSTGSCDISS